MEAVVSNCSPGLLFVYGNLKVEANMAVISTVEKFTEANQQVVNVRLPYLFGSRVANLNGSTLGIIFA